MDSFCEGQGIKEGGRKILPVQSGECACVYGHVGGCVGVCV